MKLIILLAIVVFAVFGAKLPIRDTILDGYEFGNITWTGILDVGEPEVNFTGACLQDIEHHIQGIRPDFNWNMAHPHVSAVDGLSNSSKHPVKNWASSKCEVTDVEAQYTSIQDGRDYLRGIPGMCHGEPGPRKCSRVSCSENSAIYYCNDNPTDIWVPCHILGNLAEDVLEICGPSKNSDTGDWQVNGQVFDDSGYNVLVAGVPFGQHC
ncbi:hypothetical protein BJ170DRAFT_697537 [Xylariales sp. AK1849]|nr:hypothetical protein BJ170DRAFT_697537 [Xylariales sp. AK1849]